MSKSSYVLSELKKWLEIGEALKPPYEGTLFDNFPQGYHIAKRNFHYMALKVIADSESEYERQREAEYDPLESIIDEECR